jgi:hypothetical protein
MLEVNKLLKIRDNGTNVLVDKYIFTNLRMDLHTCKIFISVDFIAQEQTLFTKEYLVGECGDVDVNILIDNLHKRIMNERQ